MKKDLAKKKADMAARMAGHVVSSASKGHKKLYDMLKSHRAKKGDIHDSIKDY